VVAPDDGSDSDSDVEQGSATDPNHRIHVLERKLANAKNELNDYRALVGERLNLLPSLVESVDEPSSSTAVRRDDDSHYFKSYEENGVT